MQVSSIIHTEVKKLDSNLPVTSLRTLENQIDRSLRNERLVASLSAAFSLLSVLLSMLGLYGVMTHVVGLRTREIGVRMALGAQAGQVLRMVLGQRAQVGDYRTAGWSGRGVRPDPGSLEPSLWDRRQLSGAPAGLLRCSSQSLPCFACYIPARRAAHVDPVKALRYE